MKKLEIGKMAKLGDPTESKIYGDDFDEIWPNKNMADIDNGAGGSDTVRSQSW